MNWLGRTRGLGMVVVAAGLSLMAGCSARALGDGSVDSNSGGEEGVDEPPFPGEEGTIPGTSTSASTTSASGGESGCLDGGCGIDLGDDPIGPSGINPNCDFGTYQQGATPVGGPCTANEHCESGVCGTAGDHPPQQGYCDQQHDNCGTYMFGQVRDIVTGVPVEGANVDLVSLLSAIANPQGATPFGSAVTSSNGRFIAATDEPVVAPIALAGLVDSGPTGVLTARSVMANPTTGVYGPATPIHDLYALQAADADNWSKVLLLDPEIAARASEWLPIGQKLAIVGIVVDGSTGARQKGLTVAALNSPGDYPVRYLDDAGDGFNSTATGTSGVFVIFGTGAAPTDFGVYGGNTQVGTFSSGASYDVVFTVVAAI